MIRLARIVPPSLKSQGRCSPNPVLIAIVCQRCLAATGQPWTSEKEYCLDIGISMLKHNSQRTLKPPAHSARPLHNPIRDSLHQEIQHQRSQKLPNMPTWLLNSQNQITLSPTDTRPFITSSDSGCVNSWFVPSSDTMRLLFMCQ